MVLMLWFLCSLTLTRNPNFLSFTSVLVFIESFMGLFAFVIKLIMVCVLDLVSFTSTRINLVSIILMGFEVFKVATVVMLMAMISSYH